MKPKIYIAGPMKGRLNYNRIAFDQAEKILRGQGFNPINPFIINKDYTYTKGGYLDNKELREVALIDCAAITTCDYIYMLVEWERSVGAQMEHSLAVFLGLGIIYEGSGLTENGGS